MGSIALRICGWQHAVTLMLAKEVPRSSPLSEKVRQESMQSSVKLLNWRNQVPTIYRKKMSNSSTSQLMQALNSSSKCGNSSPFTNKCKLKLSRKVICYWYANLLPNESQRTHLIVLFQKKVGNLAASIGRSRTWLLVNSRIFFQWAPYVAFAPDRSEPIIWIREKSRKQSERGNVWSEIHVVITIDRGIRPRFYWSSSYDAWREGNGMERVINMRKVKVNDPYHLSEKHAAFNFPWPSFKHVTGIPQIWSDIKDGRWNFAGLVTAPSLSRPEACDVLSRAILLQVRDEGESLFFPVTTRVDASWSRHRLRMGQFTPPLYGRMIVFSKSRLSRPRWHLRWRAW